MALDLCVERPPRCSFGGCFYSATCCDYQLMAGLAGGIQDKYKEGGQSLQLGER